MAKKNRNTLKGFFETGKNPTEGQYANLIDSFVTLSDENTGSLNIKGNTVLDGHLTASGGITASGTLVIGGEISASGGISSSGTIEAQQFVGDGRFLTNITSSTINTFGVTASFTSGAPTGSLIISGTLFHSSASSNILMAIESTGSIIPADTSNYDLGSPTNFWKSLFVSNSFATTYTGIFNGAVSGSTLSSAAQGTAVLTTNGVAGSTIDLGLQTTDSVSFASITSSGDITASSGIKANLIEVSGGEDQGYRFVGDPDTAIYQEGPNAITFKAGSTDTFTISATGISNIGNSILGNASSDTHLFTGHITASGNISASGTIFANNFQSAGGDVGGINFTDELNLTGNLTASGDISSSGTITANSFVGTFTGGVTGNATGLTGTPNISVGNITASSDVSSSGTITANSLVGTLATAAQTNITSVGTLSSLTVTNHITASGNISGSATSTGSFGQIEVDGLFSRANDANTGLEFSSDTVAIQGNNQQAAIFASQHIILLQPVTASADISASGNIIAPQFHIGGDGVTPPVFLTHHVAGDNLQIVNGGLLVQNDITASQNISASGLLFASSSVGNFSDVVVQDLNTGRFYTTSSTALASSLTAAGISSSFVINSATSSFVLNSQTSSFVSNDGSAVLSAQTGSLNNLKISGSGNNSISISSSGDITASGNISASGIITALTGSFDNILGSFETDGFISAMGIGTPSNITSDITIPSGVNAVQFTNNTGNLTIPSGVNYTLNAGATTSTPFLLDATGGGATMTGHLRIAGDVSASGLIKATSASFGNLGVSAFGDISSSGNITASGDLEIRNITSSGTSTLGGTVYLSGSIYSGSNPDTKTEAALVALVVTGSIIPEGTNKWSLGSTTNFFKDLYVSEDSIKFVSASGEISQLRQKDVKDIKEGIPVELASKSFNAVGSDSSVSDLISYIRPQAIYHPTDDETAILLKTAGKLSFRTPGGDPFIIHADGAGNDRIQLGSSTTNNTRIEIPGFISASKATANHVIGGITTFGDSTITVNGPAGHITASGNISASGNITIANLSASNNLRVDGIGSFSNLVVDGAITGSIISGSTIIATTLTGSLSGNATGLSSTPSISITQLTASATISSSGDIVANNLTIANTSSLANISITGNVSSSGTISAVSMSGDGSGLTGVTAEWDGSRNGNAEITGSLTIVGGVTASVGISSSTIVTTGGVTLGNGSTDRHLITGNITSSGNLSSSGTITALSGSFGDINISSLGATNFTSHITSSGNISASGTITGLTGSFSELSSSGDMVANSFIATGNALLEFQSVQNPVVLRATINGIETYQFGDSTTPNATLIAGSNINLSAPTTASIISASGKITAKEISVIGHITASGNISASGTIFADNFQSAGGDDQMSFTDNINLTGNLTASGDISSSGTGSFGILVVDQNITSSNISASGTLTAGTLTAGTTTVGALTATTLNTGQGANELYDMDQNVKTTSNVKFGIVRTTNNLINSGSTTLGNASADIHTIVGNVTSSGNISSSGTITAATLSVATFSPTNLNTGDITGSNISASGFLSASNIHTVGDITLLGNISGSGTTSLTIGGNTILSQITASGILSSSNNIIASQISASTFSGDGSGLTNITAEWDGTLNGDAQITGSLILSGSGNTNINVLGDISGSSISASGTVYAQDIISSTSVTGIGFTNPTTISSNTIIPTGHNSVIFVTQYNPSITVSAGVEYTVSLGADTNILQLNPSFF